MNSSSTPLVSILIPLYNAEAYVAETLDSVLTQTYTNWECIVVDDHSTDDSVKVVDAYCQQHPNKIKLYTNPCKGACAARNVAFEKSSGEFIQYLDADDLLGEDKIEKQMALFRQYGNQVIVNGRWGRFYQSPHGVKWEVQTIDQDYENPIHFMCEMWHGKGMVAQHAWLTPRNLIEKAGGWDESLLINQDGEFFCRVLMEATGIRFAPDAFVFYRSGMSHSVSKKKISIERARSLLSSYQSYELVLKREDNMVVRKALANNYLNFIYQYHSIFPALAKEAEASFFRLNVGKMWPVGGKRFWQVASLLGLKNTLLLKSLFD